MGKIKYLIICIIILSLYSCSFAQTNENNADNAVQNLNTNQNRGNTALFWEVKAGEVATAISIYVDANGDIAFIPKDFKVSTNKDENIIKNGLVIIGSDENEFVWIPLKYTTFERQDFDSRGFYDDVDLADYKRMFESATKYGGFYMGRYEASKGDNNLPRSKKAPLSKIWVHIPPQNMIVVCNELYKNNETANGFLPWGINHDTTLKWLIDSKCKTTYEVVEDSTSWGNYSNNEFAAKKGYAGTGTYEETKSNNIYDLAGNNWEWTNERSRGGGYAARGGGYSVMGGACPGNYYPSVVRSGLPGNDHHPNITFRVAMYVTP